MATVSPLWVMRICLCFFWFVVLHFCISHRLRPLKWLPGCAYLFVFLNFVSLYFTQGESHVPFLDGLYLFVFLLGILVCISWILYLCISHRVSPFKMAPTSPLRATQPCSGATRTPPPPPLGAHTCARISFFVFCTSFYFCICLFLHFTQGEVI